LRAFRHGRNDGGVVRQSFTFRMAIHELAKPYLLLIGDMESGFWCICG